MQAVSVFWHRRDLRLEDNAGLYHALKSDHSVLPIFIFDTHILDKLEDKDDARVSFIHRELGRIHQELEALGSSIQVYYGKPEEIWPKLLDTYEVKAVYANHDFEPYALERDGKIRELLDTRDVPFHTYKDHVIFEKDDVLKDNGTPYTVYTPYSKKWFKKLDSEMVRVPTKDGGEEEISKFLQSFPNGEYFGNFVEISPTQIPSLADMGFEPTSIEFPPSSVTRGLIRNYGETRNFPAVPGTSRLGLHYRFGTISIREKARNSRSLSWNYINELCWRDFYAMILSHFPHVIGNPFREKYKYLDFRNNEKEFEAWCNGQTGYPIVDAGMRELNQTGYMHNRVRMIVASFLTKHLLIDWRWGEAYFARKLLDFDLASNNGGWQWAAGCGSDAAHYFRVFNPESQMKKFDKELKYVRQWVPEYGTPAYQAPIVDHKMARERCLRVYKESLNRAAEIMEG
ncbi:MAG: deoxyribodipyrimidine photo-lyase [Bacteroidota bacterium]